MWLHWTQVYLFYNQKIIYPCGTYIQSQVNTGINIGIMTHVLYSNPPISQLNSLCNEFTSVWPMFVYNS